MLLVVKNYGKFGHTVKCLSLKGFLSLIDWLCDHAEGNSSTKTGNVLSLVRARKMTFELISLLNFLFLVINPFTCEKNNRTCWIICELVIQYNVWHDGLKINITLVTWQRLTSKYCTFVVFFCETITLVIYFSDFSKFYRKKGEEKVWI